MSANTRIEWTDRTWSPIRARVRKDAAAIAKTKGYTSLIQIAEKMAGHVGPHCEHVSSGCDNCYAESNNHRCLPANGTGLPFDRRSRDLVEPFLDETVIGEPFQWRKAGRVFVENQSDLFGEWVTSEMLFRVIGVMEVCDEQTFQVLTKRAERCVEVLSGIIPAPNIWIGFSAEGQKTFDDRWAHMKKLAAAGWLVFCSYEPALFRVDMGKALQEGLRWVIVGGESGRGARPFEVEWARTAVEQCREARIPCFVKQLGACPVDPRAYRNEWPLRIRRASLHAAMMAMILKHSKGGDPSEWPKQIRVREFPEVRA